MIITKPIPDGGMSNYVFIEMSIQSMIFFNLKYAKRNEITHYKNICRAIIDSIDDNRNKFTAPISRIAQSTWSMPIASKVVFLLSLQSSFPAHLPTKSIF